MKDVVKLEFGALYDLVDMAQGLEVPEHSLLG